MKSDEFENKFEKLKKASENISREDINLKDAAKYYKEGMSYYDECMKILENIEEDVKEDLDD